MTYTSPDGTIWHKESTYMLEPNAENERECSLTEFSNECINSRRDAFLMLFDEQISKYNLEATNIRGRYTASLYAKALDVIQGRIAFDRVEEDVQYLTTQSEANLLNRSKWVDFSMDEILAIYGFYILMGARKEKNIEDALSMHGNRLFSFPAAGIATCKRRLWLYTNSFGLSAPEAEQTNDKITKVRHVIDVLRANCVKAYNPDSHLVVDEQMLGYQGRTSLKQYIPTKPDKYGIKIWVMVDKNKYIYNFQIYAGQEGERVPVNVNRSREVDQAHRVVMDMVSVLDKSLPFHLTTDRLFTRMITAKMLLQRNITLLGTIRSDRVEVPEELRLKRRDGTRIQRATNSIIYVYHENYTLMSYCPKPNKLVYLLSSRHGGQNELSDDLPKMIHDYNQSKCYVDTVDFMLKKYSSQRPTMKWTFALFTRLIDIAALNAMKLYFLKYPQYSSQSRKHFLASLAMELITPWALHRYFNCNLSFEQKLDIAKYIDITPFISEQFNRVGGVLNKKRRCTFCGPNSNNKSRYQCERCTRCACRKHCQIKYTVICESCWNVENAVSQT